MGGKITLTDPSVGDYFYQEAIKTLRTNVQFSGKKNKVIMVTSVFSDEGKSDITFHLATAMAEAGKRTILVDADIRKSVYLQHYSIKEQTVGLTQYLSGQIDDPYEMVYETNYENFSLVLAGPDAPNPAEILGDEMFGDFIKQLSQQYDYVFIDTAPLGSVIDAAVVSQWCNGAILVIESGAVSYRAAQKVLEQLGRSGVSILGAVLNKCEPVGNGKYGKYSKYGKYGHYGRYGKYGKYGYGRHGKYGYGHYGEYGHYGRSDSSKYAKEKKSESKA